jgi:hypothetical protein
MPSVILEILSKEEIADPGLRQNKKMSGLWVAVETWFYLMKWRWNWETLK